jgi:hypothetical protein
LSAGGLADGCHRPKLLARHEATVRTGIQRNLRSPPAPGGNQWAVSWQPHPSGFLPLKFNGGYLAADILFFAPAAFFNLREAFPFYEFDIEKQVVKFRKQQDEEWASYEPSPAEVSRAKMFFKDK